MSATDPAADLRTFVASGDESADVARLYEITDRLTSPEAVRRALPDLLGVFERNPEADLGSPGPVVHKAEEAELAVLVVEIVASLRRRPTMMAVWMAQRCLNGPVTPAQRGSLLAVLRAVSNRPWASEEVRQHAAELLRDRRV